MEAWFAALLAALALPRYGLSTVFVVALVLHRKRGGSGGRV